MHRLLALTAAALLSTGVAEAAEVSVSIGPELQKKTASYGVREVEQLRNELREEIEQALAKAGPNAPQRVDLVLESATPNRPTFNQLGRASGLSFRSIGVGGAAVTGTVLTADGRAQPLSYRWHESDLRHVIGYSTWYDAERAFDRLASQLKAGRVPNQGPYRPDLASRPAFDHRF